MITIFGTINSEGVHIDTSNTLQGAKVYATINNLTNVSKRVGYNAFLICEKVNGKWINTKK